MSLIIPGTIPLRESYSTRSKISPGDNTVRVSGLKRGQDGIYDVYQFTLANLSGDLVGFAFKTPAGVGVTGIVRDLMRLRKENLWFTAYLRESHGMLRIFSIKEPRLSQEELWSLSKKLTPMIYTPRDGTRN